MPRADPADVVRRAGGVISARQLRASTSGKRIARSLRAGTIIRLRKGRYGVPGIAESEQTAIALSGTVCHLSAALLWGWELKTTPTRPHVTLRRGRRLSAQQRKRARVHWVPGALATVETPRGAQVTDPETTIVDCLRTLPYDEALTVADSALRSKRLSHEQLLSAAKAAPRTGRARAVRAAEAADARSANPFESCLRAICHEVAGLSVEPQVQIGLYRVDLCDRQLRIVIEAESRTWHAGPDEHTADIRRYTTLVREGWLVVRFSYFDVMHDQGYVIEVLRDIVALAQGFSSTHSSHARRAS